MSLKRYCLIRSLRWGQHQVAEEEKRLSRLWAAWMCKGHSHGLLPFHSTPSSSLPSLLSANLSLVFSANGDLWEQLSQVSSLTVSSSHRRGEAARWLTNSSAAVSSLLWPFLLLVLSLNTCFMLHTHPNQSGKLEDNAIYTPVKQYFKNRNKYISN